MSQAATETHPRVVIVGAAFGGLTAAKRLAKAPLDVTIVDQHNYHLARAGAGAAGPRLGQCGRHPAPAAPRRTTGTRALRDQGCASGHYVSLH
jgi:flavin-dependent dehydrogenase